MVGGFSCRAVLGIRFQIPENSTVLYAYETDYTGGSGKTVFTLYLSS
jgi:hypothetical protein